MASLRPPSSFSIAPGVVGFRTLMVNYFFVRAQDRADWVLIDAGLRFSGPRLLREATRHFGGRPPSAIVLTHGHFDHVGALPWLLRRWQDVPIYAHPAELPFLNDRVRYPAPEPRVGGGFMAWSSLLYPRTGAPIPQQVEALPADGSVPALPGWRWIPTAGHSSGHVSLWRDQDRVLISGDAVITTRQESALAVLRQSVEVRPPPAYFTPDWRTAYASLVRLRALQPHILAAGHGLPVMGGLLHDGLARLVENFPTIGLPRHGRYVPPFWQIV
jgi:glyoxylase-like metal-dependent hydrolase (beta-lactamase superfamily II)